MYKTAYYTSVALIIFSLSLLIFFTASKNGWFGLDKSVIEPFYFAFWSVLLIFGVAGIVVSKKMFKE